MNKIINRRQLALASVSALSSILSLVSPSALAMEQIVRPYQGVRSSGMGGTRITTGLYEDNFFGNPARATSNPKWKVNVIDPTFEVNSSGISNIGNITKFKGDDLGPIADTAGSNNHIRYQMLGPAFFLPPNPEKERKFAFQFALINMSVQADVAIRRSYQADPDILSDIGPAFTIARQFMEDNRLSVGLTPHITYRVATKQDFSTTDLFQGKSFAKPAESGREGAHIDVDLGGTYEIPYEWRDFGFQAGASVNNSLGGTYRNLKFDLVKAVPADPRQQPRAFNLGINAHRASWGVWSDTLFAFELTDIGNNPDGSLFRTVHIGAESHWKLFAVRAGINQGYLTAGLGFDFKILQIDLATYGEEMSLNPGGFEDRRYAVRFALQF